MRVYTHTKLKLIPKYGPECQIVIRVYSTAHKLIQIPSWDVCPFDAGQTDGPHGSTSRVGWAQMT